MDKLHFKACRVNVVDVFAVSFLCAIFGFVETDLAKPRHQGIDTGNQRRYKADVLRRVSVIKAAQKMGISLEAIKRAFAGLPGERTPTQKDWQKLSAGWQAELDGRIAYLERLRDSLTGCIGCGCLSMKKCPIYNEDDKLSAEGSGAVILEQAGKTKS